MTLLNLPISTSINRAIPKNSFDKYTNTKQRKQFSEYVDKIRWTNKLSVETINLHGKDISEIQIFEIKLKKKESIADVLTVIDRAIPYNIIFLLSFEHFTMYVTSQKHAHPINENTTVIDWTFRSAWLSPKNDDYQLNLKQSLDFVFTDFCKQLAGRSEEKISLAQLIDKEAKIKELKKTINLLQAAIKKTKQFNKKVELNIDMRKCLMELEQIK